MNRLGTFELDVSLGDPAVPARVKVAIQRHTTDDTGRVFITPECSSFEEIEGEINAMQDELDRMRERARRVFQRAL